MINFLSAVFSGIGFAIFLFGIGCGVSYLIENFCSTLKLRRERDKKLLELIERIEANTRTPRP